jgi:hypothetical protein
LTGLKISFETPLLSSHIIEETNLLSVALLSDNLLVGIPFFHTVFFDHPQDPLWRI